MTTLESVFSGRETAVARDLKLNLKNLLLESPLGPEAANLALLALASSLGDATLKALALGHLEEKDLSPEQLQEAEESAAIMGMLNVYYRFKHMLTAVQGEEAVKEHYRAAGLRMNSLAKPALGKERFEMLAFAVSVLNGCDTCINAHERELLKLGSTHDKIHDLARLAAVAKGLNSLLRRTP